MNPLQTDSTEQSTAQPAQEDTHAYFVQFLSTMILQLNALQALVREDAPVEAPLIPPVGASAERSAARFNPSRPPPIYRPQVPDMDALRSGLADLEQMTRKMLDDLRNANDDMSLAELSGITLSEALSRAVEEMAEKLGLSSRILFSGEERPLPASIEGLLYRVAREALYAVQQHIGVHRLRFTFNYGRDEIQMSIEDDGISAESGTLDLDNGENPEVLPPPFAPSSLQTETVLASLRHRLEHLGGSLELSTNIEHGTQLQVKVPYVHTDVGADLSRPSPIYRPSDARIRILIVDSQTVTRAGLRRLLESYPDLEVVGEAADGIQAVSETLELGPQVVLMDTQLPNGQSLEALRQIKQLNPDTRVLLLSALDREEYLYETLRAGAGGYVLKDIAPDELAAAVRAVARGEVLIQPQLAGRLLSRFGKQTRGNYPYQALTAREQEVLRLLARGLRNKEIAARLQVSERTVNFHLANIYSKLNVSGRTEALSKALEQGLITA